MRKLLGGFFVALFSTALVQAHALYLVSTPEKTILVFSDDLEPDARVKEATWQKLAGTKVMARLADGKTVPVEWEQADHHIAVKVPEGAQILTAMAQYGISPKSETPTYLEFYATTVVGDMPAKLTPSSDTQGIDVLPVVEAGKVRFQVTSMGKPVAGASVRVNVFGASEEVDLEPATTDDKGMTQPFGTKGRYQVTVRHTVDKKGKFNDAEYEKVMYVGSLVADLK